MFKKRFFAYIVDFIVLELIISFVTMFIPLSTSYTNLSNQLVDISNNFLLGDVSFTTYFNQFYSLSYSMDKEMFLISLVGIVISILYFVVYPLYNNGQSIGKKIMKIRIVDDNGDVNANAMIFRYLLMYGIGVSIINLCLICFVSDFYYMIFSLILSFLQFLVVIISIFMVLYRSDFKSLPDLIAGTKVIEVKE